MLVYRMENFKNILLIGNFYELYYSFGFNKFQKNGVIFILLLFYKFENEGEFCVLVVDILMYFDLD